MASANTGTVTFRTDRDQPSGDAAETVRNCQGTTACAAE
jgi:hypothetical protein